MKLYILSAPRHIIIMIIITNDNKKKQEEKTIRKYTKRLIMQEAYGRFLYSSLSFSVASKFSIISMYCIYNERRKYSKSDSKTNTATN